MADNLHNLFDALDLDQDGALERGELHRAALGLSWHWPEAPIFALLDHFTIREPLSRDSFVALLTQVLQDPRGPYGQVLLRSPVHSLSGEGKGPALLIIDPQRSFTSGAWMRSIGPGRDQEIVPIKEAFKSCGELISTVRGRVETMFTRCPFPPDSYQWDEALDGTLDRSQLYFIKPGNSVLWPDTNGFRRWVEGLLRRGVKTLVLGGCTLNSCVRVSSVETKGAFQDSQLELVVDLSLCGARASNYQPSTLFGGRSPVEAAIDEMKEAGVLVVSRYDWP